MLGYPATAVQAFLENRRMPVSALDYEIQLPEVGKLTYFMLSDSHWREELDQVQYWVDLLLIPLYTFRRESLDHTLFIAAIKRGSRVL